MIERMIKVTLIGESAKKHKLLTSLKELGIMHISDLVEKNPLIEEMQKKSSSYTEIVRLIEEAVKKSEKVDQLKLTEDEFITLDSSLKNALQEKKRLEKENFEIENEISRIIPFGTFHPEEVKQLEKDGVKLYFYTLIPKELKKLKAMKDIKYLSVSYNGKLNAVATVNAPLSPSIPAAQFEMPKDSLASMQAKLLENKEKLISINNSFISASAYLDEYRKQIINEDEKITFEKASATFNDDGALISISGYVPEEKREDFKKFCTLNNVAYVLDEIKDSDNPPTEVKNKGPIKIIRPVFDMLGLVPGYREHDISLWFLVFLTLFFAMILGDAGYGLIFVLIAIGLNIKTKKCTLLNSLIYVFGIATVVWGALTGTWFGSEYILTHISFLKYFVYPPLTNFPSFFGLNDQFTQDTLMKFCFMLGTIQISLACVINIVTKIPKKDLSLFSDLGWLIDILVLYLLVLFLVIGESVPFKLIVIGIGVGFVLTCLFGSFTPGIKFAKGIISSLGGFFTNFLNTISCFSNIMSYIRLFAVGMASLAIAESFNDMAIPLLKGFMMPAGILVIVIGHAINLVMGLLSVVVHGVRLNVLEFSNQLGMEWTGYKYEPFRERVVKS